MSAPTRFAADHDEAGDRHDAGSEPRPRRHRRAATVAAILLGLALAGAAGYGAAILVTDSVAAPPVTMTNASPPPGTLPAVGSPTPSASSPAATRSPGRSPRASASAAPGASPRIHIVARGDNLTRIARRYGVTVEAIVEANDIRDANTVILGQRLVIPNP